MNRQISIKGTVQDIPVYEFERRTNALQTLMHQKKIDACLFTTEAEFQYFSGFRTPFWKSPSRPWFLLIPRHGNPVAVIPDIGLELMKKTWVTDIRTWSSPNNLDEGVSLLCDILDSFSRVGMLMGMESQLRMSMLDLNVIVNKTKIDLIDCSLIVQSLRMIKSENEIELIGKICEITSTAFNEIPNIVYSGQSFEEATKEFRVSLFRNGAEDVPYLVGGLGNGGYNDIISPVDQRKIGKGSLLMFDTGSTYKGYFSDFDRNFGFDKVSSETMKTYELLWNSIKLAMSVARPGKTVSQVFYEINSYLGASHSSVGRYGHGVGLQLTEPPSIAYWDETILSDGMVLAIEPSFFMSNNKVMVLEENIVIRDGEPQLLTVRAPEHLILL